MNRVSPVSANPTMPVTCGCVSSSASESAIAPWNAADFASAPGVSDRKRTMIELLPAPNSWSSRADTAADSELASSQPPDDRADDAWLASVVLARAMRMAIRATGLRKRYTNAPHRVNIGSLLDGRSRPGDNRE